MGACSAEEGPAGSAGERLGVDACTFSSVTPSKPVKRHNGRFYWLTRDVAPVPVPPPSGPDFRYTNFSGGRGSAFYLHTLFEWPGFCILPIHTFDHAARPSLKKSNEIHTRSVLYIEKVFALRALFY